MSSFKINKTEQNVLDVLNKIENRLIVKKENNVARLFFDYDEDTRLEIKSINTTYHSNVSLNTSSDTITINKNSLSVYGDIENANNVNLGLLVSDGSNIGIISGIENDNVTITMIYKPQTITWNEYY